MAKDYTPLTTHPLSGCKTIAANKHLPEVAHLDDAAIDILIDFTVATPITIGADRSMVEARRMMEDSHNAICLVTDDSECILGIIALQDIIGSKPVKILNEARIERKELKVKHIMISVAELEALDFDALTDVKVGHIIATLHEIQQHYILVSEKTDEQIELRGIFIDSQISKQLGVSIRSNAQHLSVAELQHKLS